MHSRDPMTTQHEPGTHECHAESDSLDPLPDLSSLTIDGDRLRRISELAQKREDIVDGGAAPDARGADHAYTPARA